MYIFYLRLNDMIFHSLIKQKLKPRKNSRKCPILIYFKIEIIEQNNRKGLNSFKIKNISFLSMEGKLLNGVSHFIENNFDIS